MSYTPIPCPNPRIQAMIDRLPKLRPEEKKLWVDALLSGKYRKTKGRLRRGNSFCCLGVACDVMKAKVGHKWNNGSFAESFVFLPLAVQRVLYPAGFSMLLPNPDVYYGGKSRSLSSLNDEGVDFKMIAGLIINQL